MKPLVLPELSTPARHPASYGRSAGCRAGVDNSALFPTRPVSTYKSGIAVQTNRATSKSRFSELLAGVKDTLPTFRLLSGLLL